MATGTLQMLKLRIGVVQFSPKIGQVKANLIRVKEMTDSIQPGTLDLLCFPEMAFTGYNFGSASAVAPVLEKPRVGLTSVFCSDLARRLRCYVVAGYPELLETEEIQECTDNDRVIVEASDCEDGEGVFNPLQRQIVGANSAGLFSPLGEWIGGYRKTNLFKTDKTWAAAGSGFVTFNLPPPLYRVTLAICMDLNPFPPAVWDLESGPYELADYCKANNTNLLVLLNAWLDPGHELDNEPSWSTLQYWAARLRPLWYSRHEKGTDANKKNPEAITTIICNRTGQEGDVTFAGSSALFQLSWVHGKPKLVDMMTKEEEGIRIWTIQDFSRDSTAYTP